MQNGCGIQTKLITGKPYVYVWKYRNGKRHDIYIGPAAKPTTHRLALQTKIKCLEEQQDETTTAFKAAIRKIQDDIQKTQEQLAELQEDR